MPPAAMPNKAFFEKVGMFKAKSKELTFPVDQKRGAGQVGPEDASCARRGAHSPLSPALCSAWHIQGRRGGGEGRVRGLDVHAPVPAARNVWPMRHIATSLSIEMIMLVSSRRSELRTARLKGSKALPQPGKGAHGGLHEHKYTMRRAAGQGLILESRL